jgi:hypothetical protein
MWGLRAKSVIRVFGRVCYTTLTLLRFDLGNISAALLGGSLRSLNPLNETFLPPPYAGFPRFVVLSKQHRNNSIVRILLANS